MLFHDWILWGLAMLRFVVYLDKRDEWRWRLLAANNRTIADSGEGYVNRDDCLSTIMLIQTSAGDSAVIVSGAESV